MPKRLAIDDTRRFAQHRFEYADGAYLNYEVHGSGDRTVVFLHGFGASLDSWNDIKPLLPADGVRYYYVDLKGFGLSSRPRDGRYSHADQARLVTAFIEQVAGPGVVLAGQSYGGSVALRLAVEANEGGRPELVDRLVLISAPGYVQRKPMFIRVLRSPLLSWVVFKLVPARLRVLDTHRRIFFSPETITEERLARYIRHSSTPHARYSFSQTARQIIPHDAESLIAGYPRLDRPALLIWGEHDPVVPLEFGRRLAHDLPHAHLEVLPRCGHVPQEEQPEATARLIAEFVGGAC